MSALAEPIHDRIHVSVRWKTLFYPFPPQLLIRILPRLNWLIPEQITRQAGLRPDLQLEDGVIARKASFAVQIGGRIQSTLGISAASTEGLVNEFIDIEDALYREISFDSVENASFYEFVANGLFPSASNPVVALHSALSGTPMTQRVSEVLGWPVEHYGIRLTTAGASPDQLEWFDLKIEPSVQGANLLYSVNTVYRSAARESVMDFVQSYDSKVTSIVSTIEQ